MSKCFHTPGGVIEEKKIEELSIGRDAGSF
jgi:hypothetical protein